MGSDALWQDAGGANRKTAIALFAFAALILAAGVTPHWRMTPDSALYAGIARSLATGRGYTFSGDPQVSIPPVVPLYLSLAYRLARLVEPGISPQRIFLYLNAFSAVVGFAGLAAPEEEKLGLARISALFRKFVPVPRRITGFVILAVVAALNAPSIAGEIALGRSKDFYDRYGDGDARDYFAISSALSADPGGGRVLAKNVRVVAALSGARAVQLFFHPRSRSEYTVAAVGEFVGQYDVTAIVIDPAHEKTAAVLAAFVKQYPDDWSHKGSFGRLDLYTTAGRSCGDRGEVEGK